MVGNSFLVLNPASADHQTREEVYGKLLVFQQNFSDIFFPSLSYSS